MAATANSLRLGCRACAQLPSIRAPSRQLTLARRTLSTTSTRWAGKDDTDGDAEPAVELPTTIERSRNFMAENVKELAPEGVFSQKDIKATAELIKTWESLPDSVQAKNHKKLSDFKWEFSQHRKAPKVAKDSFWNEDEQDPDMITDEIGEDDFEEDDMMSMAHGKLEEHREYREYARITVWEMPLLASKAVQAWHLTGG